MTVDEWLNRVTEFLGREMTDNERIQANTYYREKPLLAAATAKFMKFSINQASGTRLTRVRNQDDTDIPDNEPREGN